MLNDLSDFIMNSPSTVTLVVDNVSHDMSDSDLATETSSDENHLVEEIIRFSMPPLCVYFSTFSDILSCN